MKKAKPSSSRKSAPSKKKAAGRKPAKTAKSSASTKGVRKTIRSGLSDLDPARGARLEKALKTPHVRYLKILLDLRDRLLDGIEFHASDNLKRTQRDASSDLSAYSFHMADAGTDNFDREFALSMISNQQEALYEINDAIKRIETGAFGICEMCGKPIPRARLDAIPWTRYTVECQSEVEKTRQRRPRQSFQLSDFGNTEEETAEDRDNDE
ncbi:MAG: TraR/DksA C4-type zinc finger protein [Verrucomicrobiae bacterium]|nr:TraR/DksA C4-type zinc finger protein [Verrucomicrobiae bacterium]